MKAIKSLLLSCVCLVAGEIVSAQWNTSGNDINNTNTGNVGIGTTTPAFKLDVNGNTNILGAFSLKKDYGFTGSIGTFSDGSNTISGLAITHMKNNPYYSSSIGTINGYAIGTGLFSSSGNIGAYYGGSYVSSFIFDAQASTTNPRGLVYLDNTNGPVFTVFKNGNFSLGNANDEGYKFNVNGSTKIDGQIFMKFGTVTPIAPNVNKPFGMDMWFDATDTYGFGHGLYLHNKHATGASIVAFGALDANTSPKSFVKHSNSSATLTVSGENTLRLQPAWSGNTELYSPFLGAQIANFSAFTKDATFYGGAVINENGDSKDFRVEGDTDPNLIFAAASVDKVGIGTITPSAKLHVAEAAASSANIRSSGPSSDNNWGGGIEMTSANGTSVNAKINSSVNGMFFSFGGTQHMQIKNDGVIGIGPITSYPVTGNYKLAVGGNIIAEKVRVKLQSAGWPDYVFDADYPLQSLAAIDAFIKKHKHLPGVPAAAEIEREGLDLGDGQAILLQKIEELTLHLIELNKRVEKLEKENYALRTKENK